MEDRRNIDSSSKRDKKKLNISSKLNKLEFTFRNDRDIFYRNSLHDLQNKLATLQQGTNDDFQFKRIQLEEIRDYELVKLKLWQQYQINRIQIEHKQDLNKAKLNHEKMIKLIKEKLFDKLQRQKQDLKEEKFLLNVVNGSSWNSNHPHSSSLSSSLPSSELDRRSLRKREYFGKLIEEGEISDGNQSQSNIHNNNNNNNNSNNNNNNNYNNNNNNNNNSGYLSSGKRRRIITANSKYSSNDELSSSNALTGTGTGTGTPSIPHLHNLHKNNHSGYESNLSDKDYDALNLLIMENDEGGKGLDFFNNSIFNNGNGSNGRVQTRGAHKQFIGPQGLKPDELNEDLLELQNAINNSVKK
ncbi:unnamed protein product [Candida verbasci]|uniref:Transcriptional regulatory protein SDS3 n=1 Tax=Candida verbasci TaxID=1227364 RepID=A0A9W4X8I1_9ASCO|nr:unnamed protein product [Candida verbasci]